MKTKLAEDSETLDGKAVASAPACSALFSDTFPPYPEERATFGKHWIGPESYRIHKESLIARYESDEDSDGQTVEVYCYPAPARFYKIRVLDSPNSIGEMQKGFEMGTGSSCAKLAADIAEAVSEGMLGLNDQDMQ